MDAFFSQRCVTSDARPEGGEGASTWSTACRSELALVQEQRGAFGASRAVLASVLAMVAECKKTSKVLLITLDVPGVARNGSSPLASKLVTRDYSADTPLLRGLLDESCASRLIGRLQHDVDAFTNSYEADPTAMNPGPSSRPLVVAIDALNVLLQSHSLVQVLLFVKKLRAHPLIGSVIARIDASVEAQAVTQALAAAATVLVMVETRLSLGAYCVLAKERQREIPKTMDGLVQLVRLKKNARVGESIEFFRVYNGAVTYFDHSEANDQSSASNQAASSGVMLSDKSAKTTSSSNNASVPAPMTPSAIPLPVSQEDVSFNLSMSAEEQAAKSKVQLPYMHHSRQDTTNSATVDVGGSSSLFFIDEDDPDWDDDDLDDDLDI